MNNPSSVKNQSKITLQIGTEKLSGFTGLQVERAIDAAADAFSFSLPWNPTTNNITRFKPFNPQIVKVRVDDELLLTGYVEKNSFATSGNAKVLNIEGRSASGTLLDWSAGPPFQFQEMTFNQLNTAMYRNFDSTASAGVAFASPDTESISEVSITIGDKMYGVFSKIASGHGLWGIPTATGRLEYKQISSYSAAVAQLEEGKGAVKSVSTTHDITKRFQKYLVVGAYEGDPTAESEVSDPETFGLAKRGRLITELSQQTTSISEAAKFSRSKAMIDAYSAVCEVDGWRYNGDLWAPGTIITLKAPGAYILSASRFMIRKVVYGMSAGGQVARLELAIPEAFDNTELRAYPWEE